MNVLVLGNGGREHAICFAIENSTLLDKLFIAPGNAGTSSTGTNVSININDFEAVKKLCIDQQIKLVIVGPEEPAVKGIYNYFKAEPELKDILILAPSAEAAQLEGSKHFAKKFMQKYGIPTAGYHVFYANQFSEAENFILNSQMPIVLKADGLAAGKGVTVALSRNEALNALKEAFVDNRFGNAGNTLIIEEFLQGVELSVFVLTDGKNYVLLPEAKDYKQVGEGNTGPNTGGMGSVSPVPFFKDEFKQKVIEKIIEPTINGIRAEKMDYKGFIFFGLINVNENPFVIEYNVRLGDPETESILPRINSDLLEIMYNTANSNLINTEIEISPYVSATVMLVSGGYPADYEKGKNLEIGSGLKGCNLFYAGAVYENTQIKTSGGRVLAVNALGKSTKEAIQSVYHNISKIHFDNIYFRKDIGRDLSEM